MTYSKSFPNKSDKSVYPKWVEVELSEEEEKAAELLCRHENKRIMDECLQDALQLVGPDGDQTGIAEIAVALFDKRASHEIFYKEEKAKEKFNSAR